MTIDIIRRLMDGLNLSHEEAQAYYASMVVTCAVEDLVPETEGGSRWRHCVGGAYEAAVAGQYSCVQVRNFPGSGVMLVVDKIVAWVFPSGELQLWDDVGGYGVVSAIKGFQDHRITGTPAGQIRLVNNAAHQGTAQVGTLGNVGYHNITFDGPWILEGGAAGQAIGVESGAVNTSVAATFWWRERDYNPAA